MSVQNLDKELGVTMKKWEIMKAHEEDGAEIEAYSRVTVDGWVDVPNPTWNWGAWVYRVKE